MPANIEKMKKDIKIVKDFIQAIEKIGGKVPSPVKAAIKAIEIGNDLGESAKEVDEWLKKVYKSLYSVCEEGASSLYDQTEMEWDDHRMECMLNIDRQYQARNLNAVLAWNNDKSVVRRLWEKFKNRLIDWTE